MITTLLILAVSRYDGTNGLWHELSRHPKVEMHGELFTWSNSLFARQCGGDRASHRHQVVHMLLAPEARCPGAALYEARHEKMGTARLVNRLIEQADSRDDVKKVMGFRLSPGNLPALQKKNALSFLLNQFTNLNIRIICIDFENKLRQFAHIKKAETRELSEVVIDAKEFYEFETCVDTFTQSLRDGVMDCREKRMDVDVLDVKVQRDFGTGADHDAALRKVFAFAGIKDPQVSGLYSVAGAVFRLRKFVEAHPIFEDVCDITNVASLPTNITTRFQGCAC